MIYERIPLSATDDRVYLEAYVAGNPSVCDGLLVIPGGGYSTVCADREGEPIALAFLGHGVNCFVLHYTVAPDGVFPVQLIEASKAIKHIRQNSGRYHVDPDRIFTAGFSAGGHLAATLGTMWHMSAVQKGIGGPDGINRPKGMILCYAVLSAGPKTIEGSFCSLLGTKTPSPEQLDAVSPDKHVDARTCPAFFVHTADDAVVPIYNALSMAEALSDARIPYEMHIYPHAPHGIALGSAMTDCGRKEWNEPGIAKWVENAVYWMKRIQ